ncbi:MAG: hypothetical protein Q8P20_01715 [bacterium]|nr:hypothetical protein [bacterium]
MVCYNDQGGVSLTDQAYMDLGLDEFYTILAQKVEDGDITPAEAERFFPDAVKERAQQPQDDQN